MSEGLLSGFLPAIYSASNKLQRNVRGLLSDPQNYLATMLMDANTRAGGLLDTTRQAVDEDVASLKAGGRMGQGAANNALAQMMADSYNVGAMTVYPQAAALETARKNAVKMLGLPENNTPMDRARALGFDTDAFHGTNRDFPAFSNDMLGAKTGARSAQKAHFSASNPEVANTYVNTSHVNPFSWEGPPVPPSLLKNKQAWDEFHNAATNEEKWAVLERYGKSKSHGQVMPLMIRSGEVKVKDYAGAGYRDETYNDVLKAAKKAKKDTVVFKNTFDPGPHEGGRVQSDIYGVFDPSRIRSRFAAFDPARVNESDLLGRADPTLLGLLGVGAGGAAYLTSDKKKEKSK